MEGLRLGIETICFRRRRINERLVSLVGGDAGRRFSSFFLVSFRGALVFFFRR